MTPEATPPDRGSLRAFIALPLPERTRSALAEVQRRLARRAPHGAVRWTKPHAIHLTLKFLGETAVSRLAGVEAALGVVARNISPFAFSLGPAGCFPNLRRPRVIHVGIEEPSGRLALLHAAIEEALGTISFAPERRRFTPHLTLGRINRRASAGEAARVGELVAAAEAPSPVAIQADRIELIRSVLKPTGAEYTILSRFTLRKEAAEGGAEEA